jgi:hypothetical protein
LSRLHRALPSAFLDKLVKPEFQHKISDLLIPDLIRDPPLTGAITEIIMEI